MPIKRRQIIIAGAMAPLAFSLKPAFAADGDTYDMAKLMKPAGADEGLKDRPEGPADAKVTVIEYASPTCPHCADWAVKVYPEFKTKYVDTGKVQLIVRPFTRNVLDAVVFLLAETADTTDNYIKILDAYFKTQSDWAISDKPRDAMLAIALQLGFTEESFNSALTNQKLFNAMEKMRKQAVEEFDLAGTPTFYINGKQSSGFKSLDELSAEIDPLLG